MGGKIDVMKILSGELTRKKDTGAPEKWACCGRTVRLRCLSCHRYLIMGNKPLWKALAERDTIYEKSS